MSYMEKREEGVRGDEEEKREGEKSKGERAS